MRFRTIRVPAFGPFTNFEIELPKAGGDFHLIHGPNEAGKSSLLRCLRALLFGIHPQTADNFLHGYTQMRIAAQLEKQDGVVKWFQRRKGNRNTLLDESDAAIPETELGEFLRGVDEAYFDSMFGLGSTELRQGADALLSGEGRLGEALFSASLGGTPVEKVIESLESEAARLFRGRAASSIRTTRKQLDECLRASKNSIIKPEAWEELRREIAGMTDKRDRFLEERRQTFIRQSWLERCRDAMPGVGELRECLRQLQELPAMPDLGDGFGEEIRSARNQWITARDRIDPIETRIRNLRAKAGGITLAPDVLEVEPDIERLHAGLGAYREQKQNLADQQAAAGLLKLGIEARCRELEISTPFSELDGLRISQVRFLTAERDAAALADAARDLAVAEEKAGALEKEIANLGLQRPSGGTGDVSRIEQLVAAFKGLEGTANGLAALRDSSSALRQELEAMHKLLAGCPAEMQRVPSLDVPLKATIERFREDFDALKHAAGELEKRRIETAAKAALAAAEIESFTRQRELPSLDDLADARARREHGWKLVLEDWKNGVAVEEFAPGTPLHEAYPRAVAAADEIADRLRTEADAVARIEEKRMQRRLCENELGNILVEMAALEERHGKLEAEWKNAWAPSGLVPMSAREMHEWRDHWEAFRRLWNQWTQDETRLRQDEAAVENAVRELSGALGLEPVGFAALLAEANTRIRAHNQAIGADRELLNQVSSKERELQALAATLPGCRTRLDEARARWHECLAGVSLPTTLDAGDAIGLLRSRREMFAQYDQWQALNQTCEDLQSRVSTYETSVSRLISVLKMETHGTEADEVALWAALEQARLSQRNHDEVRNRIAESEQDLTELRTQVGHGRELFDGMLGRTPSGDERDLDVFLRNYERKKAIDARMRTLRDSLAGFSRTESVEDFIARVEQENAAGIEGELAALEGEMNGLDQEIDTLRDGIRQLAQRQAAMEEASDESARQAQLAELATARLQHDSERFVRLQLAIHLLKSRIDRFREQNQGPFMEKASHWFSRITGTAFSGIATRYDDGDKPVISGQRTSGAADRNVAVAAMSEGTRDQLFLALRLAGLELHLADHEPMPLILDDLLVHFDDDRALRALTALREFGQRSQVLLFTHHAHLVALAESAWGNQGFHKHSLASSRTSPTDAG